MSKKKKQQKRLEQLKKEKRNGIIHICMGVVLCCAGIFCLFVPDVFHFSSETSHIISVALFFFLGIYMLIQGVQRIDGAKQ